MLFVEILDLLEIELKNQHGVKMVWDIGGIQTDKRSSCSYIEFYSRGQSWWRDSLEGLKKKKNRKGGIRKLKFPFGVMLSV